MKLTDDLQIMKYRVVGYGKRKKRQVNIYGLTIDERMARTAGIKPGYPVKIKRVGKSLVLTAMLEKE